METTEKVFAKFSGNLYSTEAALKWAKRISERHLLFRSCVGSGTRITNALTAAGLARGYFGPLGRELKTPEQCQIAIAAAQEDRKLCRKLYKNWEIKAIIECTVDYLIDYRNIRTIPNRYNGDLRPLDVYHSHDILYVVTSDENKGKKAKLYQDLGQAFGKPLKKIHVLAVSDLKNF